MHSSESLPDLGHLERGHLHNNLPPRANKELGRKVLPIEHPITDDLLYSDGSTYNGGANGEFFDFSGWKKGGRSWLFEKIFPCIGWIKSYKWGKYFQADLMAGVIVGTMLVPQAMSYTKLAGLHPVYGLYSSFVPVFTYAILGFEFVHSCKRKIFRAAGLLNSSKRERRLEFDAWICREITELGLRLDVL